MTRTGTENLVVFLENIIEAIDRFTDGHSRRVGIIGRMLGESLGFDDETLNRLEITGMIHDIGKIGVSESILNKPGKLTDAEYEIIKKHSEIGETIIKPLSPLKDCLDPIRHHHERLDGSGYPDGLKGDEISIETRIIGAADMFDALYSDRPYRKKLPLPGIREILANDVKRGFLDGKVVNALFALIDSGDLQEVFNSN